MTLLENKYYECKVISDEIDANHAGAVRICVLGITDSLDDDMQPFAFPALNGMQAVPTKGTLLYVIFDQGDINMGRYIGVAQNNDFLPEEYISEYPNVAVTNLGDDDFLLIHNRRTKTSIVTHSSDSSLIWDNDGKITHDSNKGYTNAGYGAVNNEGSKSLAVLTEGTVDPFTCTVFGNNLADGGAHQGSEYFFVTHISKATVDAINGKVDTDDEVDNNPAIEEGEEDEVDNPLYDANGNQIDTVEYYPSESYIERTDKEFSHIIIANSGNSNFVNTAAEMVKKNNNYSCHYLIGRSSDTPDTDSERSSDSSVSGGFIQFVEISNDVYFGSNATIESVNGKANKNAVVIMLVGDGTSYTYYQYNILNEVITHIKYEANDTSIKVYTTDDLVATPSYDSIGTFDSSKLNS